MPNHSLLRLSEYLGNSILPYYKAQKIIPLSTICEQRRYMRNQHWQEKFRRIRGIQPFPAAPDLRDQLRDKPSSEDPGAIRDWLRKEGTLPPPQFQEVPLNVSSTGQVFDPYVPPEGDGLVSFLREPTERTRQALESLKNRIIVIRGHVKTIRQAPGQESWNGLQFAHIAERIYIESHHLLQFLSTTAPQYSRDFYHSNRFDNTIAPLANSRSGLSGGKEMFDYDAITREDAERRLHALVTEKAYAELSEGLANKTFRWHFAEHLANPTVVHVRTQDAIAKRNTYAQVTVRIHSRQSIAIYDRFGRLMFGEHPVRDADGNVAAGDGVQAPVQRDVLEYLVFEKRLVDPLAPWRLHAKIVPDWFRRTSPQNPLPDQRTHLTRETQTSPKDTANATS